jgi:predicted DNA-binding protein
MDGAKLFSRLDHLSQKWLETKGYVIRKVEDGVEVLEITEAGNRYLEDIIRGQFLSSRARKVIARDAEEGDHD